MYLFFNSISIIKRWVRVRNPPYSFFHLKWDLPFGVVFFSPTDQFLDFDLFTVVGDHGAVVFAEHLVHFAAQHFQICLGHAFKEGGEHQVKPAIRIFHRPWRLEIVIVVGEIDRSQFMHLPFKDETILGGGGGISKTETEVQADAPFVFQESRGAGPHPEGFIFPDTPSPVKVTQAGLRFDFEALALIIHPAAGGHAVDLAVVVEAFALDGNGDHHRFVLLMDDKLHLGVQIPRAKTRPPDRQGAFGSVHIKSQHPSAALIDGFTGIAIARDFYPVPKRNRQGLFFVFAGGEFDHVGKDASDVANVTDRKREEMSGSGDRVIIPHLDAQSLHEFQFIKMTIFQIAIKHLLGRPTNLGKIAIRVKQFSWSFEQLLFGH